MNEQEIDDANARDYILGGDITDRFAPTNPMTTTVVSVELPDDMVDELETVGEATGRTWDELVCAALAEYLPRQCNPQPRRATP